MSHCILAVFAHSVDSGFRMGSSDVVKIQNCYQQASNLYDEGYFHSTMLRLHIIAKSAKLGKLIEKLLPTYHRIGITKKLKAV